MRSRCATGTRLIILLFSYKESADFHIVRVLLLPSFCIFLYLSLSKRIVLIRLILSLGHIAMSMLTFVCHEIIETFVKLIFTQHLGAGGLIALLLSHLYLFCRY